MAPARAGSGRDAETSSMSTCQNKIIADALNYAIASAPDAVKGLGLDEAALGEKLRARLAPAVLAAAAPTDR